MKQGFYQIQLDKESSDLCCFSTKFGVYKFNRLPFGLSMSPQYFQKINYQNFGDIQGVFIYIDDILIAAETEKEHDRILKQVIERAKQFNIRFNRNKVQYKVKVVKYLGHLFSEDGIRPDPERVKAIDKICEPKNVKELQSILGMLNYLRAFIPNMSELTANLRALLKKDSEFVWNNSLTQDLENIKDIIKSTPVLGIFDKNKNIVIQTDASKNGLGSVLLQEGKPIYYASRHLSSAEQNYAQIEKELLAIVFACKRFHNFIYGREFAVLTDHQPLVSLLKKNITSSHGSRIQRMRLKLIIYNFKLSYIPGKNMLIADLLSRNTSIGKNEINEEENLSEVVHTINMSKEKETLFVEETCKDKILSKLKEYIINGFPNKIDKVDEVVRRFYKYKDELIIENELVFYKDRVVVPKSLRKSMLSLLHEGHMGITKTRNRAKSLLFWPGINEEISELILSCSMCEKFRIANIKEPLLPHKIPDRPFEKIGCDVGEIRGVNFLVVIDYFSKWLEIVILQNKTAIELIRKLKAIFSVHGIPNVMICDNMPFASHDFKKFSIDWNFEIKTSSPTYPQSNGMAEKAIQIAKNILQKSEDWQAGLLEYRNTILTDVDLSPAQILMGRMTRTRLPIKDKLLDSPNQDYVRKKLITKNEKSTYYYNHGTRTRKEFQVGDVVVYRNGKFWTKAIIIRKHEAPRSYLIRTKEGRVLRRTSYHLRHSYSKDSDDGCLEYEKQIQATSNFVDRETYQSLSRIEPPINSGEIEPPNISDHSRMDNMPNQNIKEENIQNENNGLGEGLRRSIRQRKVPSKFNDYYIHTK